jgi:hypothetical protein
LTVPIRSLSGRRVLWPRLPVLAAARPAAEEILAVAIVHGCRAGNPAITL